MCRIRFRVDGLYFDELGPSRPQISVYHPLISRPPTEFVEKPCSQALISSLPVEVVMKNNNSSSPTSMIAKYPKVANEDMLVPLTNWNNTGEKENKSKSEKSKVPPPPSPSSPSTDDENDDPTENDRAEPLSSKSSHISPTSRDEENSDRVKDKGPGPKPLSTQGRKSDLDSEETTDRSPTTKKLRFSDQDLSENTRQSTKHDRSGNQTVPNRDASLIKKVRFADMLDEQTVPGDGDALKHDDAYSNSSSSHSSDHSNIDQPPPIEPNDAFSGYHRAPYISRSSRARPPTARRRVLEGSFEERIDPNDFFESPGSSRIDVGGPAVEISVSPQNGQNRRYQSQGSSAQRIRSPASPSWSGSEFESNADFYGQEPALSRFQRQKAHSPLYSSIENPRSKEQSRKFDPEPVFMVRSRDQPVVRGRRGTNRLRDTGEDRVNLKDEYHGKKISPTRDAALNNKKRKGYRPPSVEEEPGNEPDYDPFLGITVRTV